jgi:hypothetical protein
MRERKTSKTADALGWATVVTTYERLCQYVDAFASGHLNLVILTGAPGLAKSRTVRERLGDRACWIEGNATAFGMYAKLFACRDQLVVIDDVDSLYASARCVRLLKCLCQTEEEKRLAWHTAAAGLERDGIPREFSTKSRLLIIANNWRTLDRNVAAVEDRGHLISFEPSAQEVHGCVRSWFGDQEILDWFEHHLGLFGSISMRDYVRAAELKRAGLDWRETSLPRSLPKKTLLVARLKNEAGFGSEEERANVFVKLGGGCRATYFNHTRKLRQLLWAAGGRCSLGS